MPNREAFRTRSKPKTGIGVIGETVAIFVRLRAGCPLVDGAATNTGDCPGISSARNEPGGSNWELRKMSPPVLERIGGSREKT